MKLGQVWKKSRGRSLIEDADKLVAVNIDENWNGYSDLAPIRTVIAFDSPFSKSLGGIVRHSVNVRGVAAFSAEIREELPRGAIADALSLLEGVEIEEKEYHPTFTHTDDYPSIKVQFNFGSDILIFGSTSQGKERIPWEVRLGDKKWVSNSDHIPEAMELLDRYSQRDMEKRLIKFAETIPVESNIPP